MPFYAEECASMLAVTFSGGDKMLRSIVSAPGPQGSLKLHSRIAFCSLLSRPVPQAPLP